MIFRLTKYSPVVFSTSGEEARYTSVSAPFSAERKNGLRKGITRPAKPPLDSPNHAVLVLWMLAQSVWLR